MLIEKKLESNDIATLKLITGEEVIAKITEITDNKVVVTKPFTMVLTPGPAGSGAVAFAPFMLGCDDSTKIELENKNIIVMAKANSAASGQYIKATTGLETASGGVDNIINLDPR